MNDWDTPVRELAVVPPGMPDAPTPSKAHIDASVPTKDRSGTCVAWLITAAFVALGLVAFFSGLDPQP